jgi:hypothetical protein
MFCLDSYSGTGKLDANPSCAKRTGSRSRESLYMVTLIVEAN